MKLRTRLILSLALLLTLGGTIYSLSRPSNEVAAAPSTFTSAQQCKSCHAEVFAEWQGTHHQIAYTNPEVRQLSDNFRREECMPCHLPRPIAETGFGERTLARRTTFDEGVNCLSCHLAKDGSIMASRDVPSAPCQPKRNEQYLSVTLCETCHNQHFTTDQWRQSDFAKQGTDCNSCHMPEVERKLAGGKTKKGKSHLWLASHDLPTLKSAGVFSASRDGKELVLSLLNKRAGHNFPTEERSRAVDMVCRFVDADGKAGEWQQVWRGRQPYRDEPGENTQLPAGQTATVRVPIPDGAVSAEARLWYRLQPYIGDEHPQSMMLDEKQVDLR